MLHTLLQHGTTQLFNTVLHFSIAFWLCLGLSALVPKLEGKRALALVIAVFLAREVYQFSFPDDLVLKFWDRLFDLGEAVLGAWLAYWITKALPEDE